jgi:hypothetical protein
MAILGRDFLERVHSGDLHVAAEREDRDAVLGLTPLRRPELRPEADEELVHLDAERLRGREVSGLV